ncbi:flagellar hook capping FlgD N-terminal domain-containing protein [Anaerobiospirillum sp. NML120449]|uniref:flagellar hook capping FlgD N-terminal domain-containing protein n=1 Tax=Anaerobiospirillum sp. NML120449 TaxID=2932817 RepID=UPI001FF5D894|nr:flagellar hook capping FlgD N-terminal domain-containing protein [Anaerobiospirillum sp. NML120449]MCK0526660.1 hypothetical protein [Anaerobiospirillum sp. NML120449]
MASSFINSLSDAKYRSLDAYNPAAVAAANQSTGIATVAGNSTTAPVPSSPMARTGGTQTPAPEGGDGKFDYGQAGIKTEESSIKEASSKVKDQVLTQADFLQLLTAQLQAQDPTKPADNNQLVTQMSQLSMVESLNSINTNMGDVLGAVGSSAAMNATNLIGTYVYTDQKNGYFGGNVNSPALWSIDAGDEVYSNVKLTIKDAQTGEVVYTDKADTLTGEIKYAWQGILSPDGPVKPDAKPDGDGTTKPDGNGGTTDGTKPEGDKKLSGVIADGGSAGGGTGGTGTGGTGTGGDSGTTKPDGSKPDGSKPDADGEDSKYTLCNPGRYIIEVTGTNSKGQSVTLPSKGLGFVSSVSLGKTIAETKLNLNGLGELPFDKANRVTL